MPSERLRATWSHATPRERALLVLGSVVVVATVGFALVWQPLVRDLSRTAELLAETRTHVGEMQRAVNEIAGLKRDAREPRSADLRAAVERVLATSGLRGDVTALDVQDGRVRLTFAAVEFTVLASTLELLLREEQLFVVEALLATRVVPGTVRAELTLTRPPAK